MGINDAFDWIKTNLLKYERDMDGKPTICYLIVHSMDMGVLKQAEWMDFMAELCTLKCLRFIFTMDHCKSSSVLWTEHGLDKFNFVAM